MRTARRYLAREIYRSCAVVLLALMGLFTFFTMVDQLDNLSSSFTVWALLYLQVLALPTRLYDLLPIGLLIGSILALASLAQRNELVILRVSGVSGMRLLGALWIITIPMVIGATLLSEFVTPVAEVKSNEAMLQYRGDDGQAALHSGYWFKEQRHGGGMRIINIESLEANGGVRDVNLYDFDNQLQLTRLAQAPSGHFGNRDLTLTNVTETNIDANISNALAAGKAEHQPAVTVTHETQLKVPTTLSASRLLARVLTPERMSVWTLLDYIRYLHRNQLQTTRQVVALWRKAVYPFTLLIMMTIAAPVGFMQTRRGGVGAKVFIGILLGVAFFMVNQLALNVGMLTRWPPWVTAIVPNLIALIVALAALIGMEYRHLLGKHRREQRLGAATSAP